MPGCFTIVSFDTMVCSFSEGTRAETVRMMTRNRLAVATSEIVNHKLCVKSVMIPPLFGGTAPSHLELQANTGLLIMLVRISNCAVPCPLAQGLGVSVGTLH